VLSEVANYRGWPTGGGVDLKASVTGQLVATIPKRQRDDNLLVSGSDPGHCP